MKLITFSLFGDNPLYCVGAVENARLAKEIYLNEMGAEQQT